MAKFHEGEIAVQTQAGVRGMAERVGRGIHPYLFDGAAEFLAEQSMIVVASVDRQSHVWASVVSGEPGFLRAGGNTLLTIDALPVTGDPLAANLKLGDPLGLIAIDFATRSRMRINGVLMWKTDRSLTIETRQVYGNCPKYIQARDLTMTLKVAKASEPFLPTAILTVDQQKWIAGADTFFIASIHSEGGADASHRGGNPGFIHVVDEHRLIFPDYSGNMMFNTLGNLTTNPAAGLLFIDFDTGSTLQLTGKATIAWDADRLDDFPGAQRLVTFEVAEVVEIRNSLSLRFGAPEYSRFNPR